MQRLSAFIQVLFDLLTEWKGSTCISRNYLQLLYIQTTTATIPLQSCCSCCQVIFKHLEKSFPFADVNVFYNEQINHTILKFLDLDWMTEFETAHVKLHGKVNGGLISDKRWLPLELKTSKSCSGFYWGLLVIVPHLYTAMNRQYYKWALDTKHQTPGLYLTWDKGSAQFNINTLSNKFLGRMRVCTKFL